MRLLTLAILAVCLLLAGYAAATLRTSDTTTAQSTWQFYWAEHEIDVQMFIISLDSNCLVDWERTEYLAEYGVAYSCPD